jgi:DNA ligase (NAD+)
MHPATNPVPFAGRAEFDQAVTEARAAGTAYHDGAEPLMSDGDYDLLTARIAATVQLNPDWHSHGITTDIAAGASAGTVKHTAPMLSLDKATTPEEVAKFVAELANGAVAVELKLDGMAVSVNYRDGRLVQAATRGDGTTGDDVTAQVTREPGIAGLPATLPNSWSGVIRGEIYMTDADFEAANTARVAFGKKAFVNSRNAVAGSIRKVDPGYPVPMSFAAYTAAGDELGDFDSHVERMAYLKSMGFTTAAALTAGAVPPGTPIICNDDEEVLAAIAAIGECRPRLTVPIDGVVVKADSRIERIRMGASSRAPRWALAYKFAPDQAFSILREIRVSVGRTGRVGFRAVIDPVAVGGTTITFATVHNVTWILGQGLGIGSRVAVSRAGDVIPRIVAAAGTQPDDVIEWTPPSNCPQCEQPFDTTGELWRCTTPSCSLVSWLTYAASRDVWDVDGMGEEIAGALVDAELVRDVADLFTLDAARIAAVQYPRPAEAAADTTAVRRIGMATAEKLVTGIAAAKDQPLARHITALGIPKTGRSVGRWLAAHFQTLEALRAATPDDLADVDGIGPEKARSIYQGLRERTDVIDRLIAAGITTQVEQVPAEQAEALPLAGKRVVITGSIPALNRTEAQEAAVRLGATVSGSVSAKTDLVIAGTGGSTRSKLLKAEELNIKTMTGEEFVALHDKFLGR